jgi:hypothetical protein
MMYSLALSTEDRCVISAAAPYTDGCATIVPARTRTCPEHASSTKRAAPLRLQPGAPDARCTTFRQDGIQKWPLLYAIGDLFQVLTPNESVRHRGLGSTLISLSVSYKRGDQASCKSAREGGKKLFQGHPSSHPPLGSLHFFDLQQTHTSLTLHNRDLGASPSLAGL